VIVVDVHIQYYHENDEVDKVVVAAAADIEIGEIENDMDVGISQYLLDYLVVVHLVQNVR
jgi:response regulator of citrate/malate metabolism